jgi:hypothetical protein
MYIKQHKERDFIRTFSLPHPLLAVLIRILLTINLFFNYNVMDDQLGKRGYSRHTGFRIVRLAQQDMSPAP